jgi:hypothetical protein
MTMKLKQLTKFGILIFGIAMFFTACEKERTDEIVTQALYDAPSMESAKQFFNVNSNTAGSNTFYRKTFSNVPSVAHWEGSTNKKYKQTEAQDVNILYTPIYVNSSRTDIKGFIASTEQNGIVDYRKLYILYKSNDLSNGLSAYILIYGLDGNLEIAYNYENGHQIPFPENNGISALNKSSSECEGDIALMTDEQFENWWGNCSGIGLDEVVVNSTLSNESGVLGGSVFNDSNSTVWVGINPEVILPGGPNNNNINIFDNNNSPWETPNVTVANAAGIGAALGFKFTSPEANWLRAQEANNILVLIQIANFLNANREENPFGDLTFGDTAPEQFPIAPFALNFSVDLINFLIDNPELDLGGISEEQQFNDLENCYEINGNNYIGCFEELEDNIKNELTDPCARAIFTELENGLYVDDILSPEMQVPISDLGDFLNLNFSESILSLFNGSGTFDFIILNGTPSNPIANASTDTDLISTNPNRWNVTTTINNIYLANATQLSIARTMIHELVHGYLLASSNELDFTIAMTMYASENGIDTSDTNAFHHEFMGQYINAIAYSLYEWDKDYGTGGNLGWDYYYAMAFSGQFQTNSSNIIVSTTDSFLELVPNLADRQNIVNIIINEQINNNDAQGTDCY